MAATASFLPMDSKEQGEDEWNVVIKVKYGDIIKRFSTHVHWQAYAGQQHMSIEYDMNQLRAKISNLFKFSHDAALLLSYTDEDGDLVSLDSDDELRDAVISQRLNPLWIYVRIKPYLTDGSSSSPKAVKISDIRSDTAATANNGFRQLAAELNSAVDKSLKSLPDPIGGVLSNLSHEMIQTASSSPVFNELFSLLSKVQLTSEHQSSHKPVCTSMGMSSGVPAGAVDNNTSGEPKVPTFPSPVPENIQKMNFDGKSVNSKGLKDYCKDHLDEKSSALPPFAGSQTGVTSFSCPSMLHPYRRPSSCLNHMSRTFHRGVICDGCGMNPIIGPRFKSTVKENYDLCGTCFRDMGREPEYIRIDSIFRFPKAKRHPHKHNNRGRSFSTIIFNNTVTPPIQKLASLFVVDVTVRDGTLVHPGSRFTKIWRMRNTGTVAWPFGTQLVWVGGHQLGVHGTAELEIPEMGYPVDCDLDIAVDCVAPPLLGKYTSHWQMISSSGQRFGDKVWISIQVSDSQAASTCSSPTALNLNLPPESNQQGRSVIDVDSVPIGSIPVDDKLLEELLKPAAAVTLNSTSENFTAVLQPSNDIPASSFNFTSVLQPSMESPDLSFPEIPASSSPVPNPAIDTPSSTVVSYPLIDISDSSNPPDINHTTSDVVSDENPVERTLLRELEEMGFIQTDLNRDILRQNQYDLEQSVEELCELAEWDPLLIELKEMGFNDVNLNKKLLVKNGGSIKRVVMELVTGKKGE